MDRQANNVPPPPPPPCLAAPPAPPPPISTKHSSECNEGKKCAVSAEAVHQAELEQVVHKLYQWNSIPSPAVICVSRFVQHVPQSGPKCGLVALSMASSLCCHRAVETSQLLTQARQLGVTNHGEMFSVHFMQQLAAACLPTCQAQVISAQQLGDATFVAQQVALGNVLLVPYDSDRNFAPACLQGHKAHWAVLTGVLLPVPELPLPPTGSQQLLHVNPSAEALALIQPHLPSAALHVLALQGKSRHLSAWPLAQLLASNLNLEHVDPTREAGDLKYVLPAGGVCEGLRGQALLLQCARPASC